jgi:CDGSH-type Zn-finger protein
VRASQAFASRAGPVAIRPAKSGPLLLEGNLEIVSGTGRTRSRVTQTALRRCGRSSRMPYCDGTHAKVGFVAE